MKLFQSPSVMLEFQLPKIKNLRVISASRILIAFWFYL